MEKDLVKESLEMKDILARVRGQVRRLLDRGATPADLSFALAYVATELGLLVSKNPVRMFPVGLNGVGQAASGYAEARQVTAGGDEALEGAPAGVAIH